MDGGAKEALNVELRPAKLAPLKIAKGAASKQNEYKVD